MTPCLGGCALLGSVTCAVSWSCMYSVVCEWIYFVVDVCCSGFFATTRKNIRTLKPRQNEKRHCMFCQKEVYPDSKRYWCPLLGFVVPSIAYFRSMYRKVEENPRYTFFWQFWKSYIVFLPKRGIPWQYWYPPLGLLCLQHALNSSFSRSTYC